MIRVNAPSYVKMDQAHIMLIYGTALAAKPLTILELGIGSGAVTTALLNAIMYNNCGTLTVVDNWLDWNGVRPEIVGLAHTSKINIIDGDEENVVRAWAPGTVDLIVSDADHTNAHKWFETTMRLLTKNGVAFFHDVTNPMFPNLGTLELQAKQYGYGHCLFNKSSLDHEKCERGLLMVMQK